MNFKTIKYLDDTLHWYCLALVAAVYYIDYNIMIYSIGTQYYIIL